jgi:hypothetical protein
MQPLALGSFYDTILQPALEAVGLPASRPADDDTRQFAAYGCTTYGTPLRCCNSRPVCTLCKSQNG